MKNNLAATIGSLGMNGRQSRGNLRRGARASALYSLLPIVLGMAGLIQTASAAVPAPEKLLPDDTLVVVTAPDSARLLDSLRKSPTGQFWNDPAMAPFKARYGAKFNEELIDPLQNDLGIKFSTYTNLLQGQATVALVQTGGGSPDAVPFGAVFLLDAGKQSSQLKTNLADLRKKLVDSGKALRTEKIRDVEFFIVTLSTNDIPKALQKLAPAKPEASEDEPSADTQDKAAKAPPVKTELYVGQIDSVLVVGSGAKALEKAVIHLTGGAAPALEDVPAFQSSYQAQFRTASGYAWFNAKAFLNLIMKKSAQKQEAAPSLNPLAGLSGDKVAAILGLSSLKSVALSLSTPAEGTSFQLTFNIPESGRAGLFRILAGEPKDVSIPPFIPASAVKLQRWRLDGQKTWAAIEKMISDVSPQALGFVNFMLDSANSSAQEQDPGFDIRKNLIGNLGDDMISYEKAPTGTNSADLADAPSLFLLGSPNAEKLTGAIKSLLSFASQSTGPTTTREFLGRKIYTTPLPSMPMAAGGAKSASPTLYYATSGGYVAMSTESAVLEEYLRSSEAPAKALRDLPGLAEAIQKVTGPGTDLFGYENQAETMRATFTALKSGGANANAEALAPLLSAVGMGGSDQDLRKWMDFSLLPPFDKVSKYFYFTVYGGNATADGISFKYFAPVSPQFRAGAAAAASK
jgi:hypothetical protein